MLYKWKLIILLLSTLFSSAAFSAVCENLFHKLDKRHIATTNKNYPEKILQLEKELFAAIEQCKTYSGMFVLMGELQIETGQVPLAVVYGRKSIDLDSGYWRAHKLLGSALMLTNQHEDGLKSLKKAVELNPKNNNAQLNLISALIQNKKYDKALTLTNTIIDKNDKDTLALAYYFRSQVYQNKGLIVEALNDSKKAQELGFTFDN